ncbi:unnamed protein product [Rotaria sp. Silwood1]|nr:unnamed protein product [Rotaria sp. Silwood1]
MSFESDDTDNDDNILLDNDTSTDDSEYGKNSKNKLIEHKKEPSNTASDSSYNFSNYLEIYERIYKFYCQNEHKQWQLLFSDIIKQSSTPYELLYMFLDHTLSTTNNKKHKMVIPFIEQFKQIRSSHKNIELDETIKRNILLKICRRCIFSQLESIIDIFDLRSIDNQSIVINFINEQIEQQEDIIFISQLTKILKLLEINAISFEKIEKSYSKCEHISTLQSHLSAVCDIIVIDNLFFSCGARAQIFAWQMKNNIVIRSGHFMLHPLRRRHGGGGGGNINNDENKKDNYDDDHGLDVRFTSIAAIPMADIGNYLLFVTASDAILRIFRYTISSNRFTLLQTSTHSEYCQLRVKVYSKRYIAFVSSTDGLLCAYDCLTLDNTIRSTSIKLHQSGINDFDLIEIIDNNLLRLASVGDDGSVHVSIFDINNWIWKREYSKDNIHQSPATGIRFLNQTMFVSIGIDQRLKLWTIKNDEQILELTKNYLVDIRDILSMDMIFCDEKNEFVIVIVGAGVQTIQFDLTNCLFYS